MMGKKIVFGKAIPIRFLMLIGILAVVLLTTNSSDRLANRAFSSTDLAASKAGST